MITKLPAPSYALPPPSIAGNLAALSSAADVREFALGRAIKKARRRLLPFLISMYVLAFIDRANVGFARNVLQSDLGLGEASFAFGAGVFFLGYAFFEVPSNLILHRVGARRWLSRIMVTWGLIAGCMAFTRDATSFYVLRFLLGVSEAGFFPGIILYLSLWFPTRARSQTTGMFYFGLPLALVLGGPVSGMMLDAEPPFGLHPWQFMFFAQGALASIVGGISWFYLSDGPGQAKWLGVAEREALCHAMTAEDEEKRGYAPRSLARALCSPRMIVLCLVYFAIQVAVYDVVFYLPTRIADSMGGHVGSRVGFLSAIPWVAAVPVTYVVTRFADLVGRHRQLAAAMLGMGAVAIAGAAYCHSVTSTVIVFCFAAAGCVAAQPLFWHLPTSYLRGAAAAGGIGLINAIGNLGGFVAPNLQSWVDHSPASTSRGVYALAAVGVAGVTLLLAMRASDVRKTS